MASKNATYLIIILSAATLLTGLSTYFTYRNSLIAVEDSLKLHALGIAISLEPSLYRINTGKNIFMDIVTEGRWEGIAFIALYNEAGSTILHSNENLINKVVDDDFIRKTLSTGEAIHGYITLGTEESIFALNFPVHLNNKHNVLRIALHKYPFEEIIRQAKFQAISALIVIFILWIMGFFFIRTLKQSESLNKIMEERQRLAMLGEMSSILAHEIRNPLGSIKGFAQLVLEQNKGLKINSTETEDYLRIIVLESKRLELLTDELLLYAKTAEYRPGDVDIKGLINECVKNIQANINEKQIDFEISLPEAIFIKTDHDKLKQILINIIQNSVEAISEKGLIKITGELRNNTAEISIIDNGCGMDEKTRTNAFKPFFTTKTRGTGLGLAVVERLAKSIGGIIELQSAIERGTKIKIKIPGQL